MSFYDLPKYKQQQALRGEIVRHMGKSYGICAKCYRFICVSDFLGGLHICP